MEICTLASSSSGNATLVSHGGTHILIDTGISLRRIANCLGGLGLSPAALAGILITHNHSDHVGGLQTLIKYHPTPLYASAGAGEAVCAALPGARRHMTFFEPGETFEIGALAVRGFRTQHDAPGSVGYRITGGGKSLVFATDLGCVTREVENAALGADLAILEANHDLDLLKNGSYPQFLKQRITSKHGHLSNPASARFAVQLAEHGARRFVLAHLSRENNTPKLAHDAVRRALDDAGAEEGDAALSVAPPDDMGTMYIL